MTLLLVVKRQISKIIKKITGSIARIRRC